MDHCCWQIKRQLLVVVVAVSAAVAAAVVVLLLVILVLIIFVVVLFFVLVSLLLFSMIDMDYLLIVKNLQSLILNNNYLNPQYKYYLNHVHKEIVLILMQVDVMQVKQQDIV